MQLLNPSYLFGDIGNWGVVVGICLFFISAAVSSIVMGAVEIRRRKRRIASGHQRTAFGYFIKFITGNPVMPHCDFVRCDWLCDDNISNLRRQ